MKVGKDLKIVIETLTPKEAKHFIDCLKQEKLRHIYDTDRAIRNRDFDKQWNKLRAIFWATAVKRHEQDIEEIDALIGIVERMYGL